MHVQLKLALDCPPDAAWRALRSPSVLTQVSAPFLTFEPVSSARFPERWDAGPHPVRVRALGGLVDAGTQNIDVSFRTLGAVRILEDHGGPLTGPLTVVTNWRHRMAVTAGGKPGTTLLRDRLEFSAGVLTAVLWLGFWLFWQWRGLALARSASGFARRFAAD